MNVKKRCRFGVSLGIGLTGVVLVTGEGLVASGWVRYIDLLIVLEGRGSICGGGFSCLFSGTVAAAVEVEVQWVRRSAIRERQCSGA